jgi:cupin fold WbuC family metalloprotein
MGKMGKHPAALPPVETLSTVVDQALIARVVAASHTVPRKRIIQPLHKAESACLQRMLNAIQPGSYIRPHRHAADRAESIVVLQGVILFLVFDAEGHVREHYRVEAGSGIDFEGGVWHTFIAMEPDTVLFEVKPGPYNDITDKEFASWAPEECSGQAGDYLEELLRQ